MLRVFDDDLLKRGFEIAARHRLPAAYDSMYLALAEHLQCEFWTLDQKLINILDGALPSIRHISDFTPPARPTA